MFQLSNLEIANLVKGTTLDYVIEIENEVRYMNLNITEKQKKTIANDLKKQQNIGTNTLSIRTKHIIKRKFVYFIWLWDNINIFLFSDDEESLYSTGLKLHNDIDLIDYNMELKKGG